MIKVIHLISSLDKGGAETNLFQLLKYRNCNDISFAVVNLSDEGYYNSEIRNLGIEVFNLNFKKKPLRTIKKLKTIIADYDIVCCWMYLANYVGFLCAKKYPDKKIIWNIRHSNVKLKNENFFTYCIMRRCAKISYKVDAIFYNGSRAKVNHEKIKYNRNIGKILENGCDLSVFKANKDICLKFRKENGLEDAKILLSVGRFHPIKDIDTFISAFSICKSEIKELKAVVCGNGYSPDNIDLQKLCQKNNVVIGKDIFFLGQRNDVNDIMAASDFYVLHSVSEAFPNALIQAMASGCLCVSTNVGDVEKILKDKNLIVAPKDYKAIAAKIILLNRLSVDEKQKIINENIETIKTRFTIENSVKTFESLLKDVVNK